MSTRATLTLLVAVAMAASATAPANAAPAAGDAGELSTLRGTFPGVAESVEQAPTPPLPAVTDYARDTAARTEAGRLLVSTAPLRARDDDGQVRPVDLTLEPLAGAGGPVAPRNAPFEARLEPAVGAFSLGPDADSAVRVEPVASVSVTEPVLRDGGLFQESTHVQTDSLVVLAPDGVETFEQLHDADAPERFAYAITPPPGAEVVPVEGGGLEVRRDGRLLVQMHAPVSIDAAGRAVPTRMLWDGRRLELVVDHRAGGFAYPILVDPAWRSVYDYVNDAATGYEGVMVEQEPAAGGPWYRIGVARGSYDVAGIAMFPIGGRVYPAGASAKAKIYAPGSTRIARATFSHVSHFNDRHRQTLRLALYNGAGETYDRSDTTGNFLDQQVTLSDPTATSQIAEVWLFTPPCSAGERNCPRLIPAGHSTFARVGAVTLELVDNDFPTLEATGPLRDMQGTWSNPSGERTVELTARDAGAGMWSFGFDASVNGSARANLRTYGVSCDETHNTPGQGPNICPFEAPRERFGFDAGGLAEGRTTFHVAGEDFARNRSDAGGTTLSWDVFVDRTAPTIAADGDLRSASGWSNPRGRTAIDLVARDTRAGVAGYGLRIADANGANLLDELIDACPAPAAVEAPCPTADSRAIVFDAASLPEGRVRFRADAVDHVGNVAAPIEWEIAIDRTGPVARAEGELGGGWAPVDGPTGVVVEARDRGAGVARVGLEVANEEGRSEIASKPVCSGGDCPARTSAEFDVPAGIVADGRNEFTAVAYDAAGNRSRDGDSWDAYLDTAPPQPPSGIELIERADGSVRVTWERPPQDAGAPVVGYEYLIRPLGSSGGQWQSSPVPGVTIGELPAEDVEFLVRAVEEAGRKSAYASSVWNLARALKAGRGASMVEIEPESPCVHGEYPFSNHLHAPTQTDWVRWHRTRTRTVTEPKTGISGSYRIECASKVRLMKHAAELIATRKQLPRQAREQVIAGHTETLRRGTVPIRFSKRLDAVCAPGTSVYNVSVVSVFRVGAEDTLGETMSSGREHNCNEAGAWRSHATGVTSPSTTLSRNLTYVHPTDGPVDMPATGSLSGFQAHHIVPIGDADDAYAAAAQRDAYLCFFSPNEARNGVFLRGPQYHRTRERRAFKALPAADQRRAYHQGIHVEAHYRWLAGMVGQAIGSDQVCSWGTAHVVFQEIRNRLRTQGHVVPGVPGSANR